MDVGKDVMLDFLNHFLKSEKIDLKTAETNYIKLLDGTEMLMCNEFKVLHTTNSDMITVHYQGSIIPVAVKSLSNS